MRIGRAPHALLIGTISFSLLAAGCETPSDHESYGRMANQEGVSARTERARHEKHDGENDPYYNSNYRDDDEASLNPVLSLAVAAGVGIVALGAALISLPINGAKWLSGDRPSNAARMMEDSASADNRRQGINKLLEYDFTKRDPYTARYRQIARFDTDPTVRAVAIRASNRARDASATPNFIRGLDDASDWVRLEAAKALANVPDPAATPALLRLLADPEENRDVRIAAADALKHDRTLTVARALVAVLNDREFGVAWQARRSLKYLFNRDLGYSDSAWLAYLTGPESPVK